LGWPVTADSLYSEPPQIKLIVGLGNPGPDYRDTRHNLGFIVVDHLARKYGTRLSASRPGLVTGRETIKGRVVHLLQPQRYMNRSGPPVDAFLEKFCISPREILVIHDDIDLEFGRLKIKKKGGDGGHKGIRSMIDALQTGDFARLRMGIGRSEASGDVVDHVLGQFDDREMENLNAFIDRASDAAVTVLEHGVNIAMNRFNRKSITQC
jgi:PTH1 family peptidyl-tRNA hydrolase